MNVRTLLTLGRTSNLPTVWSNVLAGLVLGGAQFSSASFALLALTGSAFYEGGMFLNDAFDAEIDARERPTRPIPAGHATRRAVLGIGFGLLGAGLLLLALGAGVGCLEHGGGALLAGALTAGAVLIYNKWHKGRAWSPLVMGACRVGLYATSGVAVAGRLSEPLLLGSGALWLYVVGLTHVARFENGSVVDRFWVAGFVGAPLLASLPELLQRPSLLAGACFLLLLGWSVYALRFAVGGKARIPRAVVSLIAGIALVDALFIALYGGARPGLVFVALAAFLLTLNWQRRIAGT